MRNFKLFLIFSVSLVLFACGDDDALSPQEQIDAQDSLLFSSSDPVTRTPQITLDIDAVIALPGNSDISTLINFGQPQGASAADYEVVLRVTDSIEFSQPQNFAENETLFFGVHLKFPDENGEIIPNGDFDRLPLLNFIPQASFENRETFDFAESGSLIDNVFFYPNSDLVESDTDYNNKYDIRCWIRRDDTFFGPYIIDPKIRIKSLNFSGN